MTDYKYPLLGVAAVLALGLLAIVSFFVLRGAIETKPASTPTVLYVTSTPRPTPLPPTSTSPPTLTPTPTPDVILTGIQALGELNTVQYNLKTVIEKRAQLYKEVDLGLVTLESPQLHLLLVSGGQVKAGVDFGEAVRYEITDDKVTVYLAAPRITDYHIDMTSLQPYYIRLDSGLPDRFVVEQYTEAVVEAQESLKQAALDSDILQAAQTNAAALVQSLILGLGFSEVDVQFLPPRGDETMELEVPLESIPTPAPFVTATPAPPPVPATAMPGS